MPSAAAARAFNHTYSVAQNRLKTALPPVAVFVGGTAGIGSGLASELTEVLKGDVDVFVVGRNAVAGKSVLDALPQPSGDSPRLREFIQCDATLMKEVVRATNEIKARTERVNYLVMSQGMMTLQGRTETVEGIDQKLALHYYSRWKFTNELMPLLQKAKNAGGDSKVLYVLSAGMGAGPVNVDDLGLKRTYSVGAAAAQGTTYNDCMTQSFAERYPALSFVHAYPGGVRTALLSSSNSFAIRMASTLTAGLQYAFLSSPADCGARLTYGLFKAPAGSSRIDNHGEGISNTKSLYASPEVNAKLWEHTVEATKMA